VYETGSEDREYNNDTEQNTLKPECIIDYEEYVVKDEGDTSQSINKGKERKKNLRTETNNKSISHNNNHSNHNSSKTDSDSRSKNSRGSFSSENDVHDTQNGTVKEPPAPSRGNCKRIFEFPGKNPQGKSTNMKESTVSSKDSTKPEGKPSAGEMNPAAFKKNKENMDFPCVPNHRKTQSTSGLSFSDNIKGNRD
jgi:hypothetical protein